MSGRAVDTGLGTAYGHGVRIVTICEASSPPAIQRIELPRWLPPCAGRGARRPARARHLAQRRGADAARGCSHAESLPLAAGSLVSRTLGRDQLAYGIHRSGSGLVARNAAHGLSARFGAHGVQVRSGERHPRPAPARRGYGRSLEPVVAAAPTAHANRVSYRRGAADEWYANGPLGLEQGFTLKRRRPARAGPLTLALSLSGNLRPALERGAPTLASQARASATRASSPSTPGRRLPARLDAARRTLLIRVEDARALPAHDRSLHPAGEADQRSDEHFGWVRSRSRATRSSPVRRAIVGRRCLRLRQARRRLGERRRRRPS